ncbi:serine/threonine-protein kinase STY13 [Lactuca sativa]|uniref:non-specific serine/threonine protein kinase n=1 Tax=Lactuca sativa TaxID=4236 RepID=A0A9R1V2Z9_LACSA|nr:serine/threonine-protein kinase STY13 [Lactuca sativa]KAJ0197909.1 hypothetical protein LSAT_V11C700365240 [Lactuca sativa]
MKEDKKVTGFIGLNNNFQDMTQEFHLKLNENMSMESFISLNMTNNGGSIAFSITNSSVGSNNSSNGSNTRMFLLPNHDLNHGSNPYSNGVGHSVVNSRRLIPHGSTPDALAQALLDPRFPTKGLENYEEWTIKLKKLNMGPAFAQGAFGKLYKGIYNGEDVAIKLLEKPEENLDVANAMEKQFQQEVKMLAGLNHPNIVRFIGGCHKPMVWCIVTEYARGGSVRQFLNRRQNRAVPLRLAVKQAADVAKGMEYVHGVGVIHRDLKSDNLLISKDQSIKIADFGIARIEVRTEGMTPEMGTYRWMAPEMIQHRPYTQKVDVYSFGIVLWELITGKLPYHNLTDVQAAFAVVNKGIRPAIPDDCLPILGEIMTRCWDVDPHVRPHFSEVVKMLEKAEIEVVTSVRKARFRSCCVPMTID